MFQDAAPRLSISLPTFPRTSSKEALVRRVEIISRMLLAGMSAVFLGCPGSSDLTSTTPTFSAEYFTAALTPGSVVPAASGNGAGTTNIETTSATALKYSVHGSNLGGITGVYIYKGAAGSSATAANLEATLCTTSCTSAGTSTDASITT